MAGYTSAFRLAIAGAQKLTPEMIELHHGVIRDVVVDVADLA